jgi:sulfatase maturation enzyme AslB (radical SAM superfamily)
MEKIPGVGMKPKNRNARRNPFHIIKGNSRWWLSYNTFSGRLTKIPPLEGKILKLYEEEHDVETIAHRFSLSSNEIIRVITEFSQFVKNQRPISPVDNSDVRTLTLASSSDCNLRCIYCQESSAKTGSYGIGRMSMPTDTALRSIDVLFEKFPHIYDIEFFGGEPLLNLHLIKEVCHYITNELGRPIWYGINTNGTIMSEEILTLAKEYNIHFLISFDGPKRVHNVCRRTASGRGTYGKIITTMKALQDNNIPLMVLCTLNANHSEFSFAEILDGLTEYTPYYQIRGVKNVSSPSIALDMLPPATLIKMGVQYADTLIEALCREEFRYYDNFLNKISEILHNSDPWKYCCDALTRIWLFPNGALYPCGMLCHNNFYMGCLDDKVPFAELSKVRERLCQQLESSLVSSVYAGRIPLCLSSMIYPSFDPLVCPKITNSQRAFESSFIDYALLRIVEIKENIHLWRTCRNHLIEVSDAWKEWGSPTS